MSLDPRELPSTLIDKPAPPFSLARLHHPEREITPADLSGKVWLLNVWASWCVACRQEHPVITSLAEQVDIVGLNYKDERDDALKWLGQWGDPYLASAHDHSGDTGIDYGVYGVPETFVDRPERTDTLQTRGTDYTRSGQGQAPAHHRRTEAGNELMTALLRQLVRASTLIILLLGPAHAKVEEFSFADPGKQALYQEMIKELRCLVCQNQNLADSNADLAQDLRKRTRELIDQGKSREEIADYMVARYGEFVLYRPRLTPATVFLWFSPVALFLILVWWVVRWQRRSSRVESGYDPDELQRARRLLQGQDTDPTGTASKNDAR